MKPRAMASSGDRLYLDWNASAPLSPEAREAALAAMGLANASSIHAEGRAARAAVETARRKLAARFGVSADRVTFTSGGTEANTMALSPGAGAPDRPAERLVVSAIEHPAVLSGGRFLKADTIVVPVTGGGVIDLDALDDALEPPGRPLVSIMAANNETGVVQPLAAVAERVRAVGGVFHTDAVQAFGKLPEARLDADLITVSGHKIGAPAGVGALIRKADMVVPPLVRGGGQERGSRGGTENVAAIAGFSAALDALPSPGAWANVAAARDRFEAELSALLPATVFGAGEERLANTSLFAPGPVPAEISLIGLDMEGFALSSGAACSSGSVAPSHVLQAMGVPPDLARAALRVSIGPTTPNDALDRFLIALRDAIVRMGEHSIS